VPFVVTIPAEARDHELAQKLKAEWPGILAWAVEGCLNWQTDGLRVPAAVHEATAAYLEAEDALAAWIEERCQRAGTAWESSSDLFASWAAWASKAGEQPGTMKRFTQQLEGRGFQPKRMTYGRGFVGFKLNEISALNNDEGQRW
jgi:putative DNA primase/helicase